MTVSENVSLAPLTTFHIGGAARYFIVVYSEKEIDEAIEIAHQHSLPLVPLGEGSNVLIPDSGIEGVVIRVAVDGISFRDEGDTVLVTVGAGVRWETLIDEVASRGYWGIENLAGIPGSVAGAVVQNIGAYGAELADVFVSADTIDALTRERKSITTEHAQLGYRTSVFKKERVSIITRVTLQLSRHAVPRLSYADLARARSEGVPLTTPLEIVRAVRIIRSRKFPDLTKEGTAGSFFKNPVVTLETVASLKARYADLPTFPQADGTMKISLAWLLDHALNLKGFSQGLIRLYENQPLVITAKRGAYARDVDAFATDIAERVQRATGITLEREVELFEAT